MPLDKTPEFLNFWRDISFNSAVLFIAGISGGLFRTLTSPRGHLKRRLLESLAGALSAVFLGPVIAECINSFLYIGMNSYLAAGFIMGTGGQAAVKAIQDKILGDIKP